MPTEINTAQHTAALVDEFGLKGRFRMQLDEVVVPVVLVGDRSRQTRLSNASYQDFRIVSALAGELFGMLIVGGQDRDFPFTTILKSLRLRSVGTGQLVTLRSDNSNLITLTGATNLVGVNRQGPDVRPGSPVIATVGTIAAAVGDIVDRIDCPADTDVIVDLEGWELPPGTAELGQFARLALFGDTVNVAVNVSLIWEIQQPTGSNQ